MSNSGADLIHDASLGAAVASLGAVAAVPIYGTISVVAAPVVVPAAIVGAVIGGLFSLFDD